ncbi:MAG: SDR family oxidoreductase [Acidobacteriota bacterium]
MPDRVLEGRAALVTGAGIRVGRAIALALAEAGADVAVHYFSSEAPARETCDRIRALGRRTVPVRADLSDAEACAASVSAAVEAFGRLDLLVHSAATFHRASVADTTPAIWDSAMAVSARAGFFLARAAAPHLKVREGRIVLISDFLAVRPAAAYVAHGASKAAVEGLVRGLAVELAPEISVNGVSPGTVLVPEGTTPDEAARWARAVPARRNGEPEDVARAVVFLCAGPSYITGQILRVDGGKTLL